MADDDLATERARLEAVAWGADSTPAEAARARIALEDLAAGRRPRRSTASATTDDLRGRDRVTEAERQGDRPPGPAAHSVDAARPATDDRVADGPLVDAPLLGTSARRARDEHHRDQRPRDEHRHDAHRRGGAGTPPLADRADRPAPRMAGDPATAGPAQADHTSEGTTGDGGGSGLQAAWRRRVRTLLWTRRPRVWIALGAAAAVGVAFAAGTVVGTARPSVPAAPSITPTAGTVTLEQLLDVPQTYADQLPGPVDAPVSLHSTRLIFTNRALDGGDLQTPWNVWAGVGTDRSTICLVATADRIESSTACYPREDALHGSVSLSAQSASGTLTLWLRGGGVQGTVTDGY
ncbi:MULTISPECIES: hypothetical protein [Curtobacterium]|uniref:hypothetical protein n=1 Tax=Curtobacterium flaccumfaciens TaxID=2035 RepID=UPI003EE4307F